MALGDVFQKELACELSPEEIEARRDRLTKAELELRAKRSERKVDLANHNQGIATSQKEVDALVDSIDSKKEMRSVDCMERRDDRRGEVETIRLDTNEVIDTRALTFEERQVTTGEHVEKGRGKKKNGAADESEDDNESSEANAEA